MRQIKFRGKRLDNGEWVYGVQMPIRIDNKSIDMAILSGGHFYTYDGHPYFDEWEFVDKNTVGQFTGMCDKNGKEIYEGDIVRFDERFCCVTSEPYIGEIVMHKGYWSVKTNTFDWITDFLYTPLFKDDFADKKTEILGNIHNNPELLEKTENIESIQIINEHEYVDLGLPSGTKWSDRNVGASSPSDYGDYFEYDKIESKYKLPSKKEFEELKELCTWTWESQGGHNGYKVTGPNGNSIFLPAAGFRYGMSLYYAGDYGNYWSSTPDESNTQGAFYLYFISGRHRVSWDYRYYGLSVRPVSE